MQNEQQNSHTRYAWSLLNKLQVGTYGEYFAKMEFTMYGFEVYTSEVDDRGIDFIVRCPPGGFFEVQVKTVTGKPVPTANPFVLDEKFKRSDHYLVALVRLLEGEPPQIFVFRGTDWDGSTGLLGHNSNCTEGKKPYYEIRLSKKHEEMLSKYSFNRIVPNLMGDAEEASEI